MEKHLHVICFTVPFPVNYGGVFDPFYKIKFLHQEGVKVHLHCFDYGTGKQDELEKYCFSIHYYSRNLGHKGFSLNLPYIIASRKSEELLNNLLLDDFPILMEGIHCTYLLNDDRFTDRKKYVRLHNIEFTYYRSLAKSTTSFLHKIFYYRESRLLKKYEKSIASKATMFWAVSKTDIAFLQNEFNYQSIFYLPVFIPEDWNLNLHEGKGSYCIYHGDLSVESNEKAVIWLLKNIFNEIKLPLVITGKNPSKKIERLLHKEKYTCLVANPTYKEMQDMIAKAQINILPSFSSTGVKLKLVNALFSGRYCIANNETVEGLAVDEVCTICNTEEEFIMAIKNLYQQPYTLLQIKKRKKTLKNICNNNDNAQQIIQWIWNE